MLHSRHRAKAPRRRASNASAGDPFAPGSDGYAERHKTRESEFVGIPGLIRVDVGAPPARKP